MWKEIKPEECSENVFQLIGKDWMLITAGDEQKANAMTASWGGFGVMWGKNTVSIVVRPERYTKEFLDREEKFTLNFFTEEHRRTLSYMGMVSGRNEDKMEKCALKTVMMEGVPAFAESRMVIICKKMFVQSMTEENFLQEETKEKWYPEKDYHTLYIAEIEKIYILKLNVTNRLQNVHIPETGL